MGPSLRLIPKTLEEAVNAVLAFLSEDEKGVVARMDEDSLLSLHASLGAEIRNRFLLWQGNTALLEACGTPHPDDAASVIIKGVWERLRERGYGKPLYQV